MQQIKLVSLLILIQLTLSTQSQSGNPVIYGAGHTIFTPDARARALGSTGVATKPDVYSVFWNPAKLSFIDKEYGIGLNYESKYSEIEVDGAYFTNLAAFYKLNSRNDVIGMYFAYYKMAESQITNLDDPSINLGIISPLEFSTKFSYSAMLNPKTSLSGDAKFIYVDYGTNGKTEFSISGGVGIFYNTDFKYDRVNYIFNMGAYLSDIGPKIGDRFLPTNLRLGASLLIDLNERHSITGSIDLNKLVIPTPPLRDTSGIIITGSDEDVSPYGAIFTSFNDAPGGFSEELKEFKIGVGLEYSYSDQVFGRVGYYKEDPTKGLRSHMSFGAGLSLLGFNFDVSYILSTEDYSALTNQLMFGLRIELNDKIIRNLLKGEFDFTNSDAARNKSRRYRRNRR